MAVRRGGKTVLRAANVCIVLTSPQLQGPHKLTPLPPPQSETECAPIPSPLETLEHEENGIDDEEADSEDGQDSETE